VTFDERGNVRDRLSYDSFGGSADPRAVYAGKLREPVTGMYDFGYRDYDPGTGRFTSVDPVKDGTNWYSFVDGDPINRRDPNGLFISVGPGLGYNERTDRYQTTDGRSIRDKSRIHITRNSESDEFYNDTMQLKVDDLVLTDAAVQSEADTPGKEHQTVPTGRYEGHLLDFSGKYDDPILLVNDELHTPVKEGNLIHPNEFTNPNRVARARLTGQHTGPWSQPLSEGCQITKGVEPFNQLRAEISRLGYESKEGSFYDTAGTLYRNPDSIRVDVKNR
jgi:RHS repeat-associated protein